MLSLFFSSAFVALAALPADAPLPPIDPDNRLRIVQHEIFIDVPPQELTTWWRSRSLNELAVQTQKIPQVMETELLVGESWSGAGTRRRIHLSDGSTALEEILIDDRPAVFRYQVFGYTSATARFVEYGVGEFQMTPEGAGTRVVWTYRFRPQRLLGKMVLGGWARRNWSPWMEGYLANLKSGAEVAIKPPITSQR